MNEKSVPETVAIFPSSESFFSARESRSAFKFSRMSPLVLAPGARSKDLSERIGASCRLISSPASRNRAIPLVARFLNFRSIRSLYRDCTELRRRSYLPENDAAVKFGCKCGSGSARLGATCCTSLQS